LRITREHQTDSQPLRETLGPTLAKGYREEASFVMYFFTRSSNIFWTISGDGPATSTS
jgi:hypothetical protein